MFLVYLKMCLGKLKTFESTPQKKLIWPRHITKKHTIPRKVAQENKKAPPPKKIICIYIYIYIYMSIYVLRTEQGLQIQNPEGCHNYLVNIRPPCWDEPSMDQCQPRGKLWTNFQGHWSRQIFPGSKAPRNWSIRISPEIHIDQWLRNLSESSGLHRYRSMKCSSVELMLWWRYINYRKNSWEIWFVSIKFQWYTGLDPKGSRACPEHSQAKSSKQLDEKGQHSGCGPVSARNEVLSSFWQPLCNMSSTVWILKQLVSKANLSHL